MHDNTALQLPELNNPDLQCALWSNYYQGCIAKGGIALQLCGWNWNLKLCTGTIDDSNYLEEVKVLKDQAVLAAEDMTSSLSFINILDKGYQAILEALIHGQKQMPPASLC
jgi:hypothetical protein